MMVDKKLAVEMVDLVQDGAAQQAARVELERAAVQRARLHRDPLGAGDIERQAGKAEAAFVADDLGLGRLEHRVDQDQRHVVLGIDRLALDPHLARAFLDAGDVDDGDLQRLADLLRGQADAARMRAWCRKDPRPAS